MENYTSGSRSLCKTNREGYERADDFHDKVSRNFCIDSSHSFCGQIGQKASRTLNSDFLLLWWLMWNMSEQNSFSIQRFFKRNPRTKAFCSSSVAIGLEFHGKQALKWCVTCIIISIQTFLHSTCREHVNESHTVQKKTWNVLSAEVKIKSDGAYTNEFLAKRMNGGR